jgi:organic radical activating enzyme
MYNLNKLCKSLKEKNIQIHLETSGAYPLTGVFDWICLSPKRLSPPLNDIKNIANELKVIISNKTDFDWAISQKENINNSCKLYLQPEWSKKDNMLPKIIDFVKINSEWTISIQTQKFMNIP